MSDRDPKTLAKTPGTAREAVAEGIRAASRAMTIRTDSMGRPLGGTTPPAYAPLSDRQLGMVEGLIASGATLDAVRKKLRLKHHAWNILRKHDQPTQAAIEAGLQADAQFVLNSFRKSGFLARGGIRKGGHGLGCARFYAMARHRLGVERGPAATNVNVQQGGVLLIHQTNETPEQMEARLAVEQNALQHHAQLVSLDGTGGDSAIDITPPTNSHED